VFMVAYLASQQVWSNFATDIFVEKFQVTSIVAGELNSIPTTIGVVLCPLLGIYVDAYGNTLKLMFCGSCLLLCGHVLLSFFVPHHHTTVLFIGCEVLLGIGMGIVQASLWPTLAQAVPPRLVTTAMGIASAMSNSAMVIFPLLTGFVHDSYGSYDVVMEMFVTTDTICIVLVVVMLVSIQQLGGVGGRKFLGIDSKIEDVEDIGIDGGVGKIQSKHTSSGGGGDALFLAGGFRRDSYLRGKQQTTMERGSIQSGVV